MQTRIIVVAVAVMLLAAGAVQATITIDTVTVGNPGNAGELSGAGAGGNGPDRICGAVSYEYNIGKYEVTAGQYTKFLNKVAATDTYGLYNTSMDYDVSPSYMGCNIKRTGASGSYAYSVDANWANRPVNYVSWGDAARFANWLHNGQPTGAQNLPTTEDGAYYLNGATTDAQLLAVTREADWKWAITSEDEWYKAAYYNPATGTYYNYPTGSNSMPSNELVTPDGGNNANFRYSGGTWSDYTIDSPYYRTPVGEFENSNSPYGTFDQGGNVWEWNESILWDACRGLRGGSFFDGAYQAWWLHAAHRGSNIGYPSLENSIFGFRVSEIPEPASMAALALGGIGMLLRRPGLRR